MPYYIVERKYTIIEDVIVKADSVYEAFQKAGDDIKCKIMSERESDYEPDYNSVHEIAYVSEKTKSETE